MVGDTDDDGILQLPLVLQGHQQPLEQVIHQPGFQQGTVGFFISRHAAVFRVLFQSPIAENLIVLVAEVGRAGYDEIQRPFLVPEELIPQTLVTEQNQIVIQKLGLFLLVVLRQIVRVIHIFVIAHGQGVDTPGVEIGVIIVEHLGIIALFRQLGCQGLAVVIGDVVKGIAALATEEGAGIDAELRIEGADTAVAGGVEIGEIDALIHQLPDGGGVVADHPVVHGFHQHQHYVFALQKTGHGIVRRLAPLLKVGLDGLLCFSLGQGIARGDGVDHIVIQILDCGLVNTADLVQPVGVEHIVIGRFRRLHPPVVGSGITDTAVRQEHQLRQGVSTHTAGNRQNGRCQSGSRC